MLDSSGHWLVIAGALFAVLAVLHSILGERLVLRRLFRDASGPLRVAALRSLLRFAWHL